MSVLDGKLRKPQRMQSVFIDFIFHSDGRNLEKHAILIKMKQTLTRSCGT